MNDVKMFTNLLITTTATPGSGVKKAIDAIFFFSIKCVSNVEEIT